MELIQAINHYNQRLSAPTQRSGKLRAQLLDISVSRSSARSLPPCFQQIQQAAEKAEFV
jgi:hypothetical protein